MAREERDLYELGDSCFDEDDEIVDEGIQDDGELEDYVFFHNFYGY